VRGRRLVGRAGLVLVVAAMVVYALFPFYWAIVSSLESGSALFSVDLLPREPRLDNYAAIFEGGSFARSLLNSCLVAGSVVGASLALATGAAYALGRVAFRGRGTLLTLTLGVSMFPQVAILSGMFELIRGLGLYNTLPGLAVSYVVLTLPFTVWVLTAFMRELPRELEEAALVDGAGPWTLVTRVLLPLLAPALVTTGLLAFVVAWNELLFALTFTLTEETRTVPVAIALTTGGSQYELPWGRIMAASVVVTLPLVALVLGFQRRIVAGLTAGAVKG
jgi:trehalose/maltose transport system permease protein